MFETTTLLCNGAFVVNSNPFIFALAKTQASRLKNSHFALCNILRDDPKITAESATDPSFNLE